MELRQVFIGLVDISGYTKFLRPHRLSLLDAERIQIIDVLRGWTIFVILVVNMLLNFNVLAATIF